MILINSVQSRIVISRVQFAKERPKQTEQEYVLCNGPLNRLVGAMVLLI